MFSSFAFANQNICARPFTSGKLHVSGTEIHDQNDNSVILKGVSTHGLAWFPRYINSTLFKQISKEWNANVIRLAMYSEDYVNGNKNRNLQLLRSGIKYAVQSDMYVIVDWHILRDNNPNQYLAEAVGFFNQISKEFATVPNIIYEICNETNGDCTWAYIKEYASVIIPVIRRHNPDAMILVGTPNYDREIQFAAQDPINIENIMYTFHFYASSHGAEMQ
ncbi:MAG: glycoside hydrolase family 5 protein [Treponema sp.]|nr:glycoside hydrolase family 5 protein [Treponema sp.]